MGNDPVRKIAENIVSLKSVFGGILAGNKALQDYMRQKGVIEEIKRVHKYAISPHSRGVSTKVNDPVPGDPKHRKLILAHDEVEMYVKLAEWYGFGRFSAPLTVDDFYHKWINLKIMNHADSNTVKRSEELYERYLSQTNFFARGIKTIKRSEWKTFCAHVATGTTDSNEKHKCLPAEERKLSRKEFGNVKTILNGLLSVAVDEEVISMNPLLGMRLENNLFKETLRPDNESQVLTDEEAERLLSWCSKMFSDTGDVAFLYPALELQIGTRIGEISALKWSDINDNGKYCKLNISRMERMDRKTGVTEVVPYTKTKKARVIMLSNEAMRILALIRSKSDSEWIFSRNAARLRDRQLEYVLQKFSAQNGIPIKSSHKLRKTCGSNLFKAGFTAQQCADFLGNTTEVFLRNYLFDTDDDNTRFEIINSLGKRPKC